MKLFENLIKFKEGYEKLKKANEEIRTFFRTISNHQRKYDNGWISF